MVNFTISSNYITAKSTDQTSELTVSIEPNNVVFYIDYGDSFHMQESEYKEFQELLKLKGNNFYE